MLNDSELRLSLEVLFFGVVVLILEFLLLPRSVVNAEDTLRVYAVTLILIGTLFAITAGFKSQDVAPAMGLFGTIAGYLLGKRNSSGDSSVTTDDAKAQANSK
jgi:Trk-type K+ transport system membrane component